MEKHTNALIEETSPYLLQHAHNPVNWVSWSEEAFERAKSENKLVLVSIGYSACHWCHVMEHESFENEEVAALMNQFFVCIKVDREERPDVDQVYMTAIQLMTQRGGWPLNCFTLPDGRPIYGGTYFQREQWMQVLKSLEHSYRNKPEEVLEYAEKLHDGIQQSEWIQTPEPIVKFEVEKLKELVLRWSHNFDNREGGSSRAPKFPLPSNYEFLLRFGDWQKDELLLKHVHLTLEKMAQGGIYDQIGGGFARYSVDMLWKVPHFEKMLYDNGQLVSLYAKAYQQTPKSIYKRIVYQTVEWIEREMLTPEGAFYSAIDADSEGVEGKFYVWQKDELENLLGADFKWVKDFYSVNGKGYWEENNYILLRDATDEVFANQMRWSLDELEDNIQRVNEILRRERAHRIKPGVDDKCLTAWNALMLKGCVDAYFAFSDDYFLLLALKNARWIKQYQCGENGKLRRNYKNGKSNIDGFLEDYANSIAAFIRLYEATFDESWIEIAAEWTVFTKVHFQDEKSKMFYFTSNETELIARKMELNDNVMPASNSVMASNLFLLGKYLDESSYIEDAEQMISNIYDGMENYGSGYSNWSNVLLNFVQPFGEICISGPDEAQIRSKIASVYLPNVILYGGQKRSLPILKNKLFNADNQIFVCHNQTCFPPVSDALSAIEIVKNINN